MPKRPFRQFLVASTLFLAAITPAKEVRANKLVNDQVPIVIAHRSADMGGLPENSLAWISYAIDHGVAAIHINPQITSDGRYVLMHDNTLNRMTDVESVFPGGPPGGPTREQRGGRDYVRDYSLDEIGQLHLLTANHGELQSVPSLEAALDLSEGRLLVLLGLKSYEVESLSAALKSRDTSMILFHELVFPGTDQSKLRELASRTGIGVAASLYRSQDYLKDLDAISDQLGPSLKMVLAHSSGLTPEFLARARELGIQVAIAGWDGPEDSALVFKANTEPWRVILKQGFAAMTDHPIEVQGIITR